MAEQRVISVIGSTGSIGRQTLDVVRKHPDKFRVDALVAHSNISLLQQQISEFKPKYIGVTSDVNISAINEVNSWGAEVACGITALKGAASLESVDSMILSVVGCCGLVAAAEGLKRGKFLALANKESLVVGGSIITSLAKESGAEIMPIDSEHSAIYQCLLAGKKEQLKRIILTCSGGAFRELSKSQLQRAKAVDALKHPTWNMGNKITIDCATLMNKGLEVIEAKHLFNTSSIEAVIHKESIIHSMVEFLDNSVIAQMSYPTMELPIMYALSHPDRLTSTVEPLDFTALQTLTFGEIDEDRFPCFSLAKSVLNDPWGCVVLNAANECAVELYLKDVIGFYDISDIIARALNTLVQESPNTVDDLLRIDKQTREYIYSVYKNTQG